MTVSVSELFGFSQTSDYYFFCNFCPSFILLISRFIIDMSFCDWGLCSTFSLCTISPVFWAISATYKSVLLLQKNEFTTFKLIKGWRSLKINKSDVSLRQNSAESRKIEAHLLFYFYDFFFFCLRFNFVILLSIER